MSSCDTRCWTWWEISRCFGKQLLGKVVADRAGHAMHTALVSRILRDKTIWEEVTFPSDEASEASNRSSEAAAGNSL